MRLFSSMLYFVGRASGPGEAEPDGGTSFTFHTFLVSLVFNDVAGGYWADFRVCGFL
jgi:hypothetical protein